MAGAGSAGIAATVEIAQEDLLRADLYNLLSVLLARPPSTEVLDTVSRLEGDASALGEAIGALTRLARRTTEQAAEREFNALFIGLARGELLPYASYYMTGFLHEKPLALLRNDMARLSIERAPNVYEPEDNIASLCEMMSGLIRGAFGAPADLATQRDFFSAHLGNWASHFFSDLEATSGSVLYAPVGTVGRVFIDIEKEAFRIGA